METKDDQGCKRRRRREGGKKEGVFKEKEDEEAEEEKKEKEGQRKKKVFVWEMIATEGEEEEQVRLECGPGAEEAQEVQMEDNRIENNEEKSLEKQEDKETKGLKGKDERKKSRKRRGKNQSEYVRNRRNLKDVTERFDEEKRSQTQEVCVMSSKGSLALSEPPIGLMSTCDLSDPVYLGCAGTGMYHPPVPVPLLYSSQAPVLIQPGPPQPKGTKRPHSPPLPHSVPQQGPQPLEVRADPLCLLIT